MTTIDKIIIFTGGGSGGHWVPLISIRERILKKNMDVRCVYLASKSDVANLFLSSLFDQAKVMQVGKLRRYLSVENIIDFFKVGIGIAQAFFILTKLRGKKIIFSSGGYVALPVVIAGYLLRIPIVIHEQTSRVGLANKISARFAKKVLVSFESSKVFFPSQKTTRIGYPIREPFYFSQKELLANCSDKNSIISDHSDSLLSILKSNKKVILFAGGANGSKLINDLVKKMVAELTKKYIVIHQTGKLKSAINKVKENRNYYTLSNIFGDEWIYLLKRMDLFIGRSGAGTVHEIDFLNKPAIFIPLAIAQKNEQYHNAKSIQNNHTKIFLEKEINELHHTTKLKLNQTINNYLKLKTDKKNKNSFQKKQPKKVTDEIIDILLQ